jgi:uncharacterized sporulation protein YeaH/YhbH (DUF444 family)
VESPGQTVEHDAMKSEHEQWSRQVNRPGMTDEVRRRMLDEMRSGDDHRCPDDAVVAGGMRPVRGLYQYHDLFDLQAPLAMMKSYFTTLGSLDELLERDKQREKDGFPRKINIGRLIKPGKGGKEKIVIVPSTVEEKFIHDTVVAPDQESQSGGTGEGEEGEVIGEQQVRTEAEGGAGPGDGQGGQHEIESNAYDMGRILTEKFELPNLKDKGKKRSLTRYTFDLTDKNRGFGQILDKKATLRQIVETNLLLGNVPDLDDVDLSRLLVSPRDRVFRILSREKDYESQAMVFFLRDYSGSMMGKPTDLIVSQHVLIYSWLIYQYARQVQTRFILHDTEAKEVPDFYTYYNSKVAGGTKVSAAFHLVNEIVEKENLLADYNIYVFHGTDGEDWDSDGRETIEEIKKMLTYANRVGITIIQNSYSTAGSSEVESYINRSGLLSDKANLFRLDILAQDADETRLIEGIKRLIAQKTTA